MKVKLKSILAGPSGSYQPGQVADIDEQMARALVDGGYAEAIQPLPEKEPPQKAGESNEPESDNPAGDGAVNAGRSQTAPKSGRKRG